MTTPLSTPVRQAKLGIASTKSMPATNEFKRLLGEQHQRLWLKHQQDLDLIDDIRSYVKARLSIERDYTAALAKLAKQHSTHITKKFTLLNQCDFSDAQNSLDHNNNNGSDQNNNNTSSNSKSSILRGVGSKKGAKLTNVETSPVDHSTQDSDASDTRLQKRLAHTSGHEEPGQPSTLYRVWSEHIGRLSATSKTRADQFEQLIMVVDKLKDIRSHKATIGKKCLDTHLKRIHEDILVSMVEIDKAKKSYYDDENQAKKARENEEKIKRKRSGLLTKFTDLQAKKEKTSAQREANDIQSTQARNYYIMALAAGNAHLQHYYDHDLSDFIHLIDDGVLDHCKVFMATLSECDINSLKEALASAQYWSKMINLTGSQRTNSIFLNCEQSLCLKNKTSLQFEPCNNDPIRSISLEHNADYALQHEIDKWFTWFKKECRNLSQLMHLMETCQRAQTEGKKSIEINGQTVVDLEHEIIELQQQIRKSEAAKLKAQARLKVIKDGGMQIEEWNVVELEIRADMARAQEELEARLAKSCVGEDKSTSNDDPSARINQSKEYTFNRQGESIKLQIQRDSDDSDMGESMHNLASVSRSASNLAQKQQTASYSAFVDPSSAWQDDFSSAWGPGLQQAPSLQRGLHNDNQFNDGSSSGNLNSQANVEESSSSRYDIVGGSSQNPVQYLQQRNNPTSMTVQSSSPLSAIVDPIQTSTSPYHGMMGEAYKSDYECDYNRTNQQMRSTTSSVEPYNQQAYTSQNQTQLDPFGTPLETPHEDQSNFKSDFETHTDFDGENEVITECDETLRMLNKRVIAIYNFDKTNEGDLAISENDVLRVTEVDDPNWVKAKNELTGEEGYIPASYVRLNEEMTIDETDLTYSRDSADAQNKSERSGNIISMDSVSVYNPPEKEKSPSGGKTVCKAVYDYKPDSDEVDEDGLPHLSLRRNETMRIIEQREEDGWWLVEKEETGERGYVPSMLVEEIESTNDLDNECDMSDEELDQSVKAMPDFEPPPVPLSAQLSPSEETAIHSQFGKPIDELSVSAAQKPISNDETRTNVASLVPTSFIVIEPTPDVESRRIEDFLEASAVQDEPSMSKNLDYSLESATKLPAEASYVVVNEDFVLEKPNRVPHRQLDTPHHETPTILEENSTEETIEADEQVRQARSVQDLDDDKIDSRPTPSVVIDSCEDYKHDDSDDSDRDFDNDYSTSATDDAVPVAATDTQYSTEHDISPYLRQKADEFTEQIIAEAIMLMPGAQLGPSTSSTNFI